MESSVLTVIFSVSSNISNIITFKEMLVQTLLTVFEVIVLTLPHCENKLYEVKK